jgi:hypothetical protein
MASSNISVGDGFIRLEALANNSTTLKALTPPRPDIKNNPTISSPIISPCLIQTLFVCP